MLIDTHTHLDDDRYNDDREAMIARAKHYTVAAEGTRTPDPAYINNRETVYEIIAKITRDILAGLT